VTFDVNVDGILNVKAKDKTSGKEQTIRIESRSTLSDADIERMTKEAELHAEEDKKKRESVEVKNTAESVLYTAEKSLKDNEGKVPEDIKKSVEEKVAALKGVKDGTDIDAIKKTTEELGTAMSAIGEAMAKQQSTEDAGTTPKEEGTAGADNVRDI
jgi:molecular chaperone DnaK